MIEDDYCPKPLTDLPEHEATDKDCWVVYNEAGNSAQGVGQKLELNVTHGTTTYQKIDGEGNKFTGVVYGPSTEHIPNDEYDPRFPYIEDSGLGEQNACVRQHETDETSVCQCVRDIYNDAGYLQRGYLMLEKELPECYGERLPARVAARNIVMTSGAARDEPTVKPPSPSHEARDSRDWLFIIRADESYEELSRNQTTNGSDKTCSTDSLECNQRSPASTLDFSGENLDELEASRQENARPGVTNTDCSQNGTESMSDAMRGDAALDYRYSDAFVIKTVLHDKDIKNNEGKGKWSGQIGIELGQIARKIIGGRQPAIIDTGATRHVSGVRDYFPDDLICDRNPSGGVRIANGTTLAIEAVGTMVVVAPSYDPVNKKVDLHKLKLADALYVPGMSETLISPKAAFAQDGTRTYFNDNNYMELKDGTIIPFVAGPKHYGLVINSYQQHTALSAVGERERTDKIITPDLIHARLGHFSHERIKASSNHTTGLDLSSLGNHSDCDACIRGGAKKAPSPKAEIGTEPRYTYFGQKVCSDTCEMPKSTPFGFTKMVCFLDMATHHVGLYFAKTHTGEEILGCLKQWLKEHKEHLTAKGLIEWRTDNHTEFFNTSSDAFCEEHGIRHTAIAPYNPQANPSERLWGTLLRTIRVMLAHANVSEGFWPFAASQAAQINNALTTRSVHVMKPNSTPYEMATGRKPDLGRFRTMFCAVECLITRFEKDMRKISKISPRTLSGIHLGMDRKRSGYFVYIPEWERLTTFRYDEVYFYENEYPTLRRITGSLMLPEIRMGLPSEEQQALDYIAARNIPLARMRPQDNNINEGVEGAIDNECDHTTEPCGPPSARTRGAREVAGVPLHNEALVVDYIDNLALTVDANDLEGLPPLPTNYKEALEGEYGKEWELAAVKEMKAKWANGTGTLVPRPEGVNVVKSKLVPSYKRCDDGSLKERRYRWVGCGYSQKEGVDYFETFTATAKAGSVRFLLGYIAYRRMYACSIDVVKAFTTSQVRETIYVEQPDGFIDGGYLKNGKPKLVYLLNKGLEGLKQSGHNFQLDNTECLTKICGMTQMETEPCMFTKTVDDKLLIILVYIDDLLVGYDDPGMLDEFIRKYKTKYNIEHKPLKGYIGMQITRDLDKNSITLSQEKYIRRMGEKFLGPADLIRETKLPCICDKRGGNNAYANLSPPETEEERERMKGKPYLSLLATVLYASVMTRPDISWHISYLCRFASNPSEKCYTALLNVCNYLVTTANLCLTLSGNIQEIQPGSVKPAVDNDLLTTSIGLHAWSDGSWKTNANYAGYAIMAFNGAIEWGSKLIKLTMHSSTEIEIAAACLASKRLMFVKELCKEMGVKSFRLPIPLLIDNSGAIELCEKSGVSKRTEHFMRWQHYCRYLVKHFVLRLHFVRSHDQIADQLTKMGDKTGFLRSRKAMLNLPDCTDEQSK